MAILVYDSSLASDLVPSAQIILLKEAVAYASGSLQSPDVFESKPCSHGSSGPSSLGRVTPRAPFVNGNRRQRTARLTKLDRSQAGSYRFVAATKVFRFLYLYPLEDDLDLDVEVEEERR